MGSNAFSSMEIDAIGEILNISLGASATAVSTMLNTRVDITTPKVSIVTAAEFDFSNLQPAIGVEITYISGLDGTNIMLLKRNDIRIIVELLMGMDIPEEQFELDEMNLSAVCEVMNQMMGASSTALSEFLGKVVNISTPVSYEIEGEEAFKGRYFTSGEEMVVVDFLLKIDNKLESEFVNVMSTALAKELLDAFLPDEYRSNGEEEAAPAPQQPAAAPAPAAQTPAPGAQPVQPAPMQPDYTQPVAPQPMMQQPAMDQMAYQTPPQQYQQMPQMQPMMPSGNEAMLQQQLQQQQMMMNQMMQQMQQMQAQLQVPKQPDNKMINVRPLQPTGLSGGAPLGEEQQENLELVMGVSLEVSVEIGRTQSMVKDILEYTKGTLVVLDKLAGDQVDLFINGQCIARGDVVVVDDNFGIRITEVLKRPELE